ncbi:MAG: sulfatase [Promethearchaeota archaeon]
MKIFLIIFDSLRKDHTGKTYGNSWIKTPNFDKFAKDSIVFDKAYPESLPTIPVRRAIHTGIRTFPFNHIRPDLRTDDIVKTPGWYPIPPHQIHLAEYLRKDLYLTSFITSTYHQFKPNMNFHLGFDQWNWIRGQEYDKLRAQSREGKSKLNRKIKEHICKNSGGRVQQRSVLRKYFTNMQDRKSENDYFPAQTFKQAVEFVKDTKDSKKVFSLIDEFDPHEPWDPPQKYIDLYADKNYTGRKVIAPTYSVNLDYITDAELKYMRACYAGEVSMCDHWFGYFIEELKNLELYDDSLFILISDHGHSIGEHNATGKIPMFLYPELIDIPFMIKPPGSLNGPKRIKKPYVYVHDILPTIFGFLGKRKLDIFDGIDLSLFHKERDQEIENRDYITCGFNVYALYKDNHYALITSNDKSDQKLFDLLKDPEWNENIAEDNPDICNELYEIINKDAKNALNLDISPKLTELKNWYGQKKKSDI